MEGTMKTIFVAEIQHECMLKGIKKPPAMNLADGAIVSFV